MDNSYWWNISTRKINCPLSTAPKGAELAFEFNSPEAGAKIGIVVNRSFMENKCAPTERVMDAFPEIPTLSGSSLPSAGAFGGGNPDQSRPRRAQTTNSGG